jgi:cytochrome P450
MAGALNRLVGLFYAKAWGDTTTSFGTVDAISAIFNSRIVVDDPATSDAISRAPDIFHKNYVLLSGLGASRFNTNGEPWRARRDMTQSLYLDAARPGRATEVTGIYGKAFAALDPQDGSGALDLTLNKAALTVFHRALGAAPDITPLLGFISDIRDIVRELYYLTWIPDPHFDITVMQARIAALLNEVRHFCRSDDNLRQCLDSWRCQPDTPADFDPVEEYVMNMFAGVETTAASLGWIIDRLATDPRIARRLTEELDQDETPHIDCFINETLRYFPPIPIVSRQPLRDIEIEGRSFAANKMVFISIVGLHHNSTAWAEPRVFDTRRAEFMTDRYDRRAFIPFASGSRTCGGARLARLELREGLRSFLRHFEVERTDQGIDFAYELVVRPLNSHRLRLRRRA